MDNYGFYVAEVVEVATQEDNRLRVRVLPYMEDIEDTACPIWSSFFRDELLTGKIGDYVWVICNNEFTMGYIFSLANYTTYQDVTNELKESAFKISTDGINLSIPTDIQDKAFPSYNDCKGIGTGTSLSLSNVKVTYWDDNCVHFIERSTGGSVQAYNNGTVYIFRPDEMFIHIGDTTIRMNSTTISIGAKNEEESSIQIEAPLVSLGKNPTANVLVNNTGNGNGAIASDYVKA